MTRLTEKQERVYLYLEANPGRHTPKEIARFLDYSDSSYIQYPLKKLLELGAIKRHNEEKGSGRKATYSFFKNIQYDT